ncbi:MAG: winged helix-turn-helix domain-containing protein [Longimicrobiales bacterium]
MDFDYQQLDELIHSRIRLSAMSILAAVEDAEFTYLRDRIGATDGNLGAHMRKLEEAGYVGASKSFVDRKPVTRYRMTSAGRDAFRRYVDRLERMIASDAAEAQ